MFVYTYTYIYTDILYFCALREPENSDTPILMNEPDPESLVSK